MEYFQKGLVGKYSCKFTIRKSDKRKISGFGTSGKDKYSRSDSTGSPDLEYQAIGESRGFCRKGKGSMGRKKKKTDTTEKLSCNLIVRITETEREQLKTRAVERGFQDTAKYCRMILRNYEVMNWSDLNRELQKLKYEINNMESMLNQIDKNVSYSTYPKETEQRFHDCVNQMKEMSQKLERLLETKERNGA